MKYWAYVNNEILGPFEKEKLLELPSFSPSLLICPQTPVGEKTEDWKEASAYPELSALTGPAEGGGLKYSAPPAPEPTQPAAALKPLTASSIEPVAPADHNFPGGDIQVNRLGKAQAEPSPSLETSARTERLPATGAEPSPSLETSARTERLAATGFEAASASQPGGGADYSSGQGAPPAAGAAPGAFERTRPAFMPGTAPELENFSRPAFSAAPAASASAAAAPAGDAIAAKLDSLAGSAVSKQDLSMALDPLRMKLDQMGEVISSIKNQQFQRDIMDKLAYLENSIGDIKAAMKTGAAQPQAGMTAAITPALTREPSGRNIFGAGPAAEKTKEEYKKAGTIVDTGSKRSGIGSVFRKLGRLILTLALLAAVGLGAVITMKNLGVFDATAFIPFPLPFTDKALPPAAEALPEQPAPAPQPQEQAQQPKAPDLSPEVIYFTRTYKASPAGPSLEDKIAENSAAAGGDYSNVKWDIKPGAEGIYEIAGVVPAKAGPLAYTYVVDYGKKTILPADELGKAAFAALTPAPPARTRGAARQKKAAARPRQKAQARRPAAEPVPATAYKPAPAPKPAAPQEDEYEYVYEEDDGTGQ